MLDTDKAYDFVIVGGGTAGLTLATRLSENSDVSVLVLEAGNDHLDDPRINIPALWPSLLGSDVDWNFTTEPQAGLKSNAISIPHGRALGGSSAINGAAFVATSQIGVDLWETLGNPGWGWADLAPYYKKAHTLSVPAEEHVSRHLGLEYVDERFRGTDGPIQASFPNDASDPLPRAWLDALGGLGYPTRGDPFSGRTYGGYTNAASIDPGTRQRSYAANAYWKPVRERENLDVVTGAFVLRVLLGKFESGVVASGVEFTKGSEQRVVQARKEVILCAGAFHSPKILELSGIGGAALLEKHGIPVVIDNPYVGENLQDQLMTGFSFEVKDGLQTKDDLTRQDPEAIAAGMKAYQESQSGPFAVGGVFSYAFLPVADFIKEPGGDATLSTAIANSQSFHDTHPIAHEHASFVHKLLRTPTEGSGGFFTYPAQGNFGGSGSGAELVTQTLLPGNFYTVAVSIMHPLSRGHTHVASANAADKPAVDPKYLAHPLDLEVLARLVRYIRTTIAQAEPLSSLFKENGAVNAAAAALGDYDDGEDELESIKRYVRDTALSSWHPTGTCSMLPREKGGVVDPELRVYGTGNLRVVDASVIPITPRGNPQSSVYAVAERAADVVKGRYGL